jgi:hypothetical protein
MSDLPLTADDIDELRDLYQEVGMPDTFQLEADTTVYDDAGGSTRTTSIIAAGPCHIQPLSGSAGDQEIAGRLGASRTRKVSLPAGLTVTEHQRLIVNGVRYEIQELAEDDVPAWSVRQVVYVRRTE